MLTDRAIRDNRDAKEIVFQVEDYLERHFTGPISLRHVARTFGYSASYLTHVFSQTTGTPVTAWLIKRRISAAQQLLANSNHKIVTVGEAVGFNDSFYFTRQFVRHVGMTPGRFRTQSASRTECEFDGQFL